jgi:hypothetical protein
MAWAWLKTADSWGDLQKFPDASLGFAGVIHKMPDGWVFLWLLRPTAKKSG